MGRSHKDAAIPEARGVEPEPLHGAYACDFP